MDTTLASSPRKVFLFSGHMIDAADRKTPRFPADKEPVAARAINEALTSLTPTADDLAVCSAACGGDLLFAESAVALSVPLEVYLPFDEVTFAAESVDFAGNDWHARFVATINAAIATRVMPRERGPLPEGANAYEQNNLWMLEAAMRFGADRLHFICLWNGEGGDGPGGSQHLMQEVQRHSGRTHWLDTTKLWQ